MHLELTIAILNYYPSKSVQVHFIISTLDILEPQHLLVHLIYLVVDFRNLHGLTIFIILLLLIYYLITVIASAFFYLSFLSIPCFLIPIIANYPQMTSFQQLNLLPDALTIPFKHLGLNYLSHL